MWTIIISVYCNIQLLDKFRYLVLQELSPYHSLSPCLLQAPTPIRDAQVCSTGRVALLGECKSWHGWRAAAFWMRLSTFKISRTGKAHPSNRKSMISMCVFRAIAVLHINPGPQGHVAHLQTTNISSGSQVVRAEIRSGTAPFETQQQQILMNIGNIELDFVTIVPRQSKTYKVLNCTITVLLNVLLVFRIV